MEEGTPPENLKNLKKSELQALKPSARRSRLLAAGATEEEVDGAEDADDALSACVQLLLKYEPPVPDRSAALAAEIKAMKPSQRRKRALDAGATEAQIDDAEDADDVTAAFVELLASSEQPSGQEDLLAAELRTMKPSARRKRATDAGATEDEVDEAADSDEPLVAFARLIAKYEQHETASGASAQRQESAAAPVEEARIAALRQELKGLRLGALHRRAISEGVDADTLEAATDSDDPKSAICELIVGRKQSGPQGRTASVLTPLRDGGPGIIDHLLNGTAAQREQAYTEIEKAIARVDIPLLCACVVPLIDVMCMDASEVEAAECRRVGPLLMKALPHDISLGACAMRNDDWIRPTETPGSALGVILAKPPAELTLNDALTLSFANPVFSLGGRGGVWRVLATLDDLPAAEMHFWIEMYISRYWAGPMQPEERNLRVTVLLMEALHNKETEDEYEIAVILCTLSNLNMGKPVVAKYQMDNGIFELAKAQLDKGGPIDWVSASRDKSGVFAAAWTVAQQAALPSPLFPIAMATQKYLESGLAKASIDTLKAWEVLESTTGSVDHDRNEYSLYFALVCVWLNMDPTVEAANRMLREAAGSLRWMIGQEQPLICIKILACTSDALLPQICAMFFGRDESGGPFTFTQAEIDGALAFAKDSMTGELVRAYPLIPNWTSVPVLSLSVSDTNKALMLGNDGCIQHLIDGLLLSPSHPRNQADQVTGPTDPAVATQVQREYAEAVSQFAVYEPGATALLNDPAVVPALRQLVEKGLSDEAKEAGRVTLVALGKLQPEAPPQLSLAAANGAAGSKPPPHLMVSYNWDHQKVILRVVSWLQVHGYLVWVDTEQMKGDTVDAMALAVEDAELLLVGVSRPYKESSNCRMEAQYALQKKKSFIPLLMQEGYEADGWLGLMLGTSLWYAMFGATLETDSAFDSRMSALCRDIGDRGRADAIGSASGLHSELRASKLSVLRKRARASGVSDEDLEQADDATDIKAAVIDLILSAEAAPVSEDASALRQELQTLELGALRKEAIAAGVSEGDLDDAYDADDIKLAVIELVLVARGEKAAA
jgi:hypothetical protein